MVATFDSIQREITQHCQQDNNENFKERLPYFLTLAIIESSRKLKTLYLQKKLSLSVASDGSFAKPYNWVDTESIFIYKENNQAEKRPLYVRNYSLLIQLGVELTGVQPLFYADYNNYLGIIRPFDGANNWKLEFCYFFVDTSPLIVNTRNNKTNDGYYIFQNNENVFTRYMPNVLFYGGLKNAYVYLKNSQKVNEITSLYSQAISDVSVEDSLRSRDQISQ